MKGEKTSNKLNRNNKLKKMMKIRLNPASPVKL